MPMPLPEPRPDELLYSTIARTAYHYGYWSPTQLLMLLFGSRQVIAVPDLPSNLADLAVRTADAWALSAEELAERHTLLGYYTHFRGRHVRQAIFASMCERGGFNQVRLGVCSGSAMNPTRFRLCLQCHEEDRNLGREAYWHRSHQLPGVLVCDRHGDVLHATTIPFRPAGRHEYIAAPQDLSHADLRPVAPALQHRELAQQIARCSASLLHLAPRCTDALPDYRDALAGRGFASNRGAAERLREAVRDCFGVDLIERSFRTEAGRDPLQWVEEVLRQPRRAMHPYRHVLMEVFLQAYPERAREPVADALQPTASRWGLYRNPAARHEAALMANMGFSIHAIANALDVDWKTAHRLLEPIDAAAMHPPRVETEDRHAWVALANAHPDLGKKALRKLNPALYARLYRHDRPWLQAFCPVAAKGSSSRARVDWHARDSSLAESVRTQAEEIRAQRPMRRVSKSHVLGCLEARALLAHQAERLPKTVAALEEVCESVEAFQVRRLTDVLLDHGDAKSITDARALWMAHIEPTRLPDGGRGLLRLARQQASNAQLPNPTQYGKL